MDLRDGFLDVRGGNGDAILIGYLEEGRESSQRGSGRDKLGARFSSFITTEGVLASAEWEKKRALRRFLRGIFRESCNMI